MTIILARFFGFYFLVVGLALLLNSKGFGAMYKSMMKNESFLFLGGVIALIVGAVVVSVHNVWIPDWPVVLTIIGWWSLIKGFGLLAFPSGFAQLFSSWAKKPYAFFKGYGLIMFFVGLFFAYQGWR